MANEQAIRNRRGTLLTTVKPGRTDTSTSLVLHGYGVEEFGQLRDNNLVHLLENFYSAEEPSNPIEGQLWWKTNTRLNVWKLTGSPSNGRWASVVPSADTLGFCVVAGDGLTGGGFPTNSPAEIILNVGAGTGVKSGSGSPIGSPPTAVRVNESEINHNNLAGYVANEHIDHTTITLTAGDGLVFGSPSAGDLTGSTRFNIVAGDGIYVTADAVAVDSSVLTVGSPEQTISGNYIVSGSQIWGDSETNPATSIAYTFINDTDSGFMNTGSDQLAFVTGGQARITIRSDGVMRAGSPYPFSADDDIPTKGYVDSLSGSGVSPTENTFIGTSGITGLTAGKIYQVSAWNVEPLKGTGTATLSNITIRDGSTPSTITDILPSPVGAGSPVFTPFSAFTNNISINWPDGEPPRQITMIVKALSTGLNIHMNDSATGGLDDFSDYCVAVELGDG